MKTDFQMQSATRWLRVGGIIQTTGTIVRILAIKHGEVHVQVVSPDEIEFGRQRESGPNDQADRAAGEEREEHEDK